MSKLKKITGRVPFIPKHLRVRNGTRSGNVQWEATYVREQQNQPGDPYQHYAYASDGTPLCAGVTRHERMNQAVANQIRHVWERWRKEYLAEHTPGDFPLKQKATMRVASLVVFPIDSPELAKTFYFAV